MESNKLVKIALGGIALSSVLTVSTCLYFFNQPPEQTISGKECAGYLIGVLSPAIIGMIPSAIFSGKEIYKDLKERFSII